ncbi:MAG: 5-methylthioadenosine phosphorylase [Clostridia bacterium]|nr:5-methylthioadenosine phosphorylase [Clostridia bacterium]
MKVAIIGGTGLYDSGLVAGIQREIVETPYGRVALLTGALENGREIVFLARHGEGHSVPPHRVNYRANIAALKKIGAEAILATAAVGSLNRAMAPGNLALVDQFLDFTKSRPMTFFEGGETGVVHIDMTEPYCPELRRTLAEAASSIPGLIVHRSGTYVCTEGPRFETPAEIEMFRRLGGDIVGMTGVPEVVLAREAGICYAAVAVITNYAAGLAGVALSHAEVVAKVGQQSGSLKELLLKAAAELPVERRCQCRNIPEAIKL